MNKTLILALDYASTSPGTPGEIVDVIMHHPTNTDNDIPTIEKAICSYALQTNGLEKCDEVVVTQFFPKRKDSPPHHYDLIMRADCYSHGRCVEMLFFGILYRRPKDWHMPRRRRKKTA